MDGFRWGLGSLTKDSVPQFFHVCLRDRLRRHEFLGFGFGESVSQPTIVPALQPVDREAAARGGAGWTGLARGRAAESCSRGRRGATLPDIPCACPCRPPQARLPDGAPCWRCASAQRRPPGILCPCPGCEDARPRTNAAACACCVRGRGGTRPRTATRARGAFSRRTNRS